VISDRLDLSFFSENCVLALSVELLRNAIVPLDDRRRVLLMIGTTEVEGEIRLFESDAIAPGESGVAFFKPEHPVYSLVADRFIIRLPTPAVTLGGGMVLDHLPRFPRRRDLAELAYLERRRSGEITDIVVSELSKRPLSRSDTFLQDANFSPGEIRSCLDRLIKKEEAGRFGEFVYSVSALNENVQKLIERLTTVLLDKSHVKGLIHEELLASSPFDRESSIPLIDYLVSAGQLIKLGDKFNLAGRGMTLKGPVKEAHDRILALLQADRYAPPTLTVLAAQGKPYQEAIKYIIDSGEGHKCSSEFILLYDVWQEVVGYVRERLTSADALTVADLKDRFGFSRKYAIPILEETDRLKLTRREGDIRIKGDRFENEEFAL
jgi:selenocysteine-specific elongation factor